MNLRMIHVLEIMMIILQGWYKTERNKMSIQFWLSKLLFLHHEHWERLFKNFKVIIFFLLSKLIFDKYVYVELWLLTALKVIINVSDIKMIFISNWNSLWFINSLYEENITNKVWFHERVFIFYKIWDCAKFEIKYFLSIYYGFVKR